MFPTRRRRRYQTPHVFLSRQLSLFVIVGFVVVFVLTGIGTLVQSKVNLGSGALKNWTTHMSVETMLSALSMEVPNLQTYNAMNRINSPRPSNVLLELVTTFNPTDPRSLIRGELPGFHQFDGEIVIAGQGVKYTDFPMESSAPPEFMLQDREAIVDDTAPSKDPSDQRQDPALTTGERKVVFIYHTHNTESFLPQLPNESNPDAAHHPEVNITLVGQRLGQELEKRGIGSEVDTTNIAQKLNDEGLHFRDSYKKSREIVQEVLAQENDVTFIFDLHRDSARRDKTTIEINGVSYARTFFVIGGRNEHYKKNLAFAETFHNKLEEAYPGLSRGVYFKPGDTGNGEYNQSLFEKNVLIEIGGVDNTLEETYHTAEALADVIADLYWEAEKVDAQPAGKDS